MMELKCCISVVNGGWSSWTYRNTLNNCTIQDRECNNPPPCGGGKDCEGEAKEKHHCFGNEN